MQQFVLEFKGRSELEKTWKEWSAAGNCFLSTPTPFSLNHEFQLILRFGPQGASLLLPARVLQILQVSGAQPSGMVVEFLRFEQYKKDISALLAAPHTAASWQGVKDFSQAISKNQTPAQKMEKFVQHLRESTQNLDEKNHYEILGADVHASQKEITQAYQNKSAEFFSQTFALPEDVKFLLEGLRKRVGEAYEILSDKQKKSPYDFKLGKVVKCHDESAEDYKKKQMDFAKHLVRMKNRANVGKGEKVYEMALKALERKDLSEALNQMRICVAFDPFNELYQQKLKEIEVIAESKAKKPSSQSKMEKVLSDEREALKGEKLDWVDE